ncbi:HAMP domain-containing sensor histidine kinase [Lewinella sp. JB7]|uniref:sensor histidine kinase n=1 Tax=Lewinella sp. JB7 TaxID=2962887 RepID=UPI0020CA19BF|nr:HAMP domain-containing sensor histidine kinase [Lewinella sp. JB7]MCP9235910.1 HAMP domain-containing histidine kinase [Lewinella sp. JB7]
MKLLQRTSRYYLAFGSLAFLVTGVLLFGVLRYVINDEMDDQVADASVRLDNYLAQLPVVPDSFYQLDAVVTTRPVAAVTMPFTFSDTLMFEPIEREMEPYRTVTYDREINGQPYRITVSRLTVENEDLIEVMFFVSMAFFALFLFGFFLLTRYLSGWLWRPFYAALAQVQHFDLKSRQALVFPPSSIDEFDRLSTTLRALTAKLRRDYLALRQFTDNASHELQTPLAIMRNQVDLMLQTTDRSEEDFTRLQHLSEALERLKKLNQALLLLTRIDNEQYSGTEPIELTALLDTKLRQLAGMLDAKSLRLERDLHRTCVRAHPVLMDVLLNNLLSNAIKHNVTGGNLGVFLKHDRLTVTNSGAPHTGQTAHLLERFTKGRADNQSLGLGLAIVAEVCERYGFALDYRATAAGVHTVCLNFRTHNPPS